MFNNRTYVAIVPARAGSKRLPKKNIKLLNGIPLIQYSIDAALKSKFIDEVIVTSDDSRVLEIAKKSKVNSIKRPSSLSQDHSTTESVVNHTLAKIAAFDNIVLLQPTSPLRNEFHIDEAIELFDKMKANSVISVCKSNYHPALTQPVDSSLSMNGFLKCPKNLDINYYSYNGAIYICNVEIFKKTGKFLNKKSFAYIMDRNSSVDIDEKIDFSLCEAIMQDSKMSA